MDKKFCKIITIIISIFLFLSISTTLAFANTLPGNYDPRDLDLMTEVKNQNPHDVCWAFAGIGALESYLKVKGYGKYDLSEEHARWNATLNNEGYGWNRDGRDAGAAIIMPGYFTSNSGIKLESDIPYQTFLMAQKPENFDSAPSIFNVTDIEYLDNNIEEIKSAILKYGSVVSSYYDSKIFLNSLTNSYACITNEEYGTNHNINIVGWDDNYSKDNFLSYNKPKNNGAWLIKNSWGPYKYDNGYMWISYEDKYLLSTANNRINYIIRNVEKKDEKEKKYEYDEYGATTYLYLNNSTGNAQEMVYANVYDFTEEYNKLHSIMFMTKEKGAKYTLYYGKVVNGQPDLKEENMIKLKSGVVPYAGYITVNTDDFILPEGKGAVVVKLDNTVNNKKVGLGCESNINYTNGKSAYIAKANIGESYIYSDNELIDINEAFTDSSRSLTIKAITKKSSDTSIKSIKVSDYICNYNSEDGTYNIILPYKTIHSTLPISVLANNKYSTVNIDNNSINVSDRLYKESFNINVEAPDKTNKTYTVNVSVSDNIIDSEDFMKYFNEQYSEDINNIIDINNVYDNLKEEEKNKVSQDIKDTLNKDKEKVKELFNYNNGIRIDGIPWYEEAINSEIYSNDSEWISLNENIIKLYKLKLIDHKTNLDYYFNNEIQITLDNNIFSQYNNLKIINKSKDGTIEIIEPKIINDKISFEGKNIYLFGIIGEKNLKNVGLGDDNKTEDESEENGQVLGDNTYNDNMVESKDSSNTFFYLIIFISSLIIFVFTLLNTKNNNIHIRRRSN
ncbi:MAG: C1 family peptidase [Clostridiales bacterium]|nr:C1 family peptidase [Clostridiales bacterium]